MCNALTSRLQWTIGRLWEHSRTTRNAAEKKYSSVRLSGVAHLPQCTAILELKCTWAIVFKHEMLHYRDTWTWGSFIIHCWTQPMPRVWLKLHFWCLLPQNVDMLCRVHEVTDKFAVAFTSANDAGKLESQAGRCFQPFRQQLLMVLNSLQKPCSLSRRPALLSTSSCRYRGCHRTDQNFLSFLVGSMMFAPGKMPCTREDARHLVWPPSRDVHFVTDFWDGPTCMGKWSVFLNQISWNASFLYLYLIVVSTFWRLCSNSSTCRWGQEAWAGTQSIAWRQPSPF